MLTTNELNINVDATNKVDTNINDAEFTVNVGGESTIDVNLNVTDKMDISINPDNFVQIALTGGGTGPQGPIGLIGPEGPTGPRGLIGPIGLTGPSINAAQYNNNDIVFTKTDGTTVILSNAKQELKGEQGIQGIQGIPGLDGDAATVNVGTTTTVNYNVPAKVVNSGTTSAAILDFELPKGQDGLGVPPGGTFNQVLAKLSSELNDTTWIDIIGAVSSVNGKAGIVTLHADDIDDTYTTHKFATGVNTGDETTTSITTKLGRANSTTSGYLDSIDWNIFNNKQEALIEDVDYLSPTTIQETYVPFKDSIGNVELGGDLNVSNLFLVNRDIENISLLDLKISRNNNQIWITK